MWLDISLTPYLGWAKELPTRSSHIKINMKGVASSKDFTSSIQKGAVSYGVSGWVKAISGETIEVVAVATPGALKEFYKSCARLVGANPKEKISIKICDEIACSAFMIIN